ncbi:gamma-butyrobetaine hydroxylase-like domain-containing protein [Gimesia fumaroli]|uniref:Gamma-butyrobetaine hydroxylase-like N-terminal domain-containing protein n=1 Tax=Gimesia fumaroli TaxID=2527976 RepID=A0A518IC95_9PLAN|nr:DUF971 domain-containing protein [Gimesia fumaroli]QDV50732.1 hypothetical protein Enr17x_27750 [Gimesia fumaroli]
MDLTPTELKLIDEKSLLIGWSDGQHRRYTFAELRKSCPCVTCRNERKASEAEPLKLPVLSPVELQPIKVEKMSLAGNYAYRITFNDGHNTGLFTFELLRELGTVVD